MRVLSNVERWVKRTRGRRPEQHGSRAKRNDGWNRSGAWLPAAHDASSSTFARALDENSRDSQEGRADVVKKTPAQSPTPPPAPAPLSPTRPVCLRSL